MSTFEPVIGLEVHIQLLTASKMFCGCANEFGRPANTLVCPVCMGLPGVLPVLNHKALTLGARVALAFGCAIQEEIVFERKHYFYPDLPKNYQISQYVKPLGANGSLTTGGNTVRIKRVHLEEDAGKLVHKPDFSLVDLNRTGVPLLEIVSEPDIYSAQQAFDYLSELKLIVQYIEASTCDMEKGFLRCDANISLRPKGSKGLGVKTELKNMNSFRQVQSGLEYEIQRQEKLLLSDKQVSQETRLWNEEKKVTSIMRSKEEAHDYRYFPEPDLVVYTISKADIDLEKKHIPELPGDKRRRFAQDYSLGENDIQVLISSRILSDLFEASVAEYQNPKKVCNWVIGPLLETLNSKSKGQDQIKVSAAHFAQLVRMMDEGKITNLIAKEVLAQIVDNDADPVRIVVEKGLGCVSDQGELKTLVKELIAANPKAVEDFRAGKEQSVMFLVGQGMRKTKGKANPNILKELFTKALNASP
ncbi:Asp-tRNA(Asn)/Glu-tRNA(Gln) amidotransferase subunit GatB [Candidatus Omnitrophota bacterium]